MEDTIKVKKSFSKTLVELGCGTECEEITVYKKEGDKIFFKVGSCKLHLLKDEFEKIQDK